MATVYLAHDLKHNRQVALKVLNPELGAVLGAERFLAEIQTTAHLQHPNILPLFDSGTADGLLYYVMPYVEGETLRSRLTREGELPLRDAIQIASGVASALTYAHRHGVIHRDVKPENILLQDGQALVADFGIALAITKAGGERITQTGISIGTPQYMSPEQAAAERKVDARSDQYSLATVLFEMLAGEPPFTGPTTPAVLSKLLTEAAPRIERRRPSVSGPFAVAIHRALEKIPADRYPTMQEFAEAIVSADGPRGGSAEPIEVPRHRAPRRRLWHLAVPGLVVVGVLAAIGWWIALHRASDETAVAFALTMGKAERPYTFASGSVVAISADGRRIAYLASIAGGVQQLHLRSLDNVSTRPISGTEMGIQPFFSPDGRWLGFVSEGKLKKVSLEGGNPVTLADVGGITNGASWNAKGDIIASVDTKLVVLPAAGGLPHAVPEDSSVRDVGKRWPVWLAGGQAALCTIWRGSLQTARIAAVSVATGALTDVGVSGSFALGVADGKLLYIGTNGALFAVRFDRRRLKARGTSIAIADQVMPSPQREGAANAALAASGSLVYVRGSARMEATLVDSRGARPLIAERRPYAFPRFSPDGKRVAVGVEAGSSTDVWLFDISSGAFTRLTTEGTLNERPEWTADGKRVLYRSNRGGRVAIWSQPIDGSSPAQRLVEDTAADIWEANLTPDARRVIYRTGTTGTGDLWFRDLTPGAVRQPVAASTFTEWEMQLSPDGRWLAYTSNESGISQVYVRAFPPNGSRQQVSIDGGQSPAWSRDGRRLYFVHGRALYAASVSSSPDFAVLKREKILEGDYAFPIGHRNYDVGPGGAFVFMKPTADDVQILVLHEWTQELRSQFAATAGR